MTKTGDTNEEVTTTFDGIYSLGAGLVAMSVCAPADWDEEKVEAAANRENPTGIGSRWTISEDEEFASGETNPHECQDAPGRKHWLLNC